MALDLNFIDVEVVFLAMLGAWGLCAAVNCAHTKLLTSVYSSKLAVNAYGVAPSAGVALLSAVCDTGSVCSDCYRDVFHVS